MVRVGGMSYACEPGARIGSRISRMKLGEKELQPEKPLQGRRLGAVAEGASGEPIWDVVSRHLRAKKTIAALEPRLPRLVGVSGNPGLAR